MNEDYQKYINALKKCAMEHRRDFTPTFNIIVSDLCDDTASFLEKIKIQNELQSMKQNEEYLARIQLKKRMDETKIMEQSLRKTLDKIDRSMECTLESDPRSIKNPECEYGWLFDRINEWRKTLGDINMGDSK